MLLPNLIGFSICVTFWILFANNTLGRRPAKGTLLISALIAVTFAITAVNSYDPQPYKALSAWAGLTTIVAWIKIIRTAQELDPK